MNSKQFEEKLKTIIPNINPDEKYDSFNENLHHHLKNIEKKCTDCGDMVCSRTVFISKMQIGRVTEHWRKKCDFCGDVLYLGKNLNNLRKKRKYVKKKPW